MVIVAVKIIIIAKMDQGLTYASGTVLGPRHCDPSEQNRKKENLLEVFVLLV